MTDSTPLAERFDAALASASEAHRAHCRKGTTIPYVSHLMGVASIVLENGADEDQAIAVLLHDAVEDQGGAPRLADIRAQFWGPGCRHCRSPHRYGRRAEACMAAGSAGLPSARLTAVARSTHIAAGTATTARGTRRTISLTSGVAAMPRTAQAPRPASSSRPSGTFFNPRATGASWRGGSTITCLIRTSISSRRGGPSTSIGATIPSAASTAKPLPRAA